MQHNKDQERIAYICKIKQSIYRSDISLISSNTSLYSLLVVQPPEKMIIIEIFVVGI